jgi:UDP-2-acetamido-2,6-beta-L-arabino-hexul-4-ose reductase
MITVLVTGSAGFVGKNLVLALRRRSDVTLEEYDLGTPLPQLEAALCQADVIFHLAGVNRPQAVEEFETVNVGLTRQICDRLGQCGRSPKIVLASSVQAEADNPYGASKKRAEEVLRRFAEEMGAPVVIYRLKNLFGKWCRPNYNSVTATFCHNIARGIPITVSDPAKEVELVYVDDVVAAFLSELATSASSSTPRFAEVTPSYRVRLGTLAEKIQSLHNVRSTLTMPDLGDRFTRCLYATYLASLPQDAFAYPLNVKRDDRGGLAEFLKTNSCGQLFVSRTKPGVVRGNHYHDTKVEKFLVLDGEALIRFRHVLEDEVISYRVSGTEFQVVDIPAGYTHSLENVGATELVVLFWASEVFSLQNPDTYASEVAHG